MAGLPSVQRVRLETLRAAEQPAPAIQSRPAATAVASMSPGPRLVPPATPPEAPIDESAFEVGTQSAQPGVGPSAAPAAAPEPVTPAPTRELSEDDKRVEDEKRWKEASPELYHRYKTLAGVYERAKSDLAQLKTEMAELKGELKALREAPRPAPVTSLPVVDTDDLTPEQKATYEEAFPVINSLSAKNAKAVASEIVAPLLKRIEELEGKTEHVQVEIKDQGENAFVNNVRSRVKSTGKDMDAIVRTPEWAKYMEQRVPYTSATVGQLLVAAHEARDLERVEEIFGGFNAPTKSDINELVTPAASGGAAPPTTPGAKKILAISKRRKASEDFRKKRISKEDFAQIEAMYKRAETEGRIDYNA